MEDQSPEFPTPVDIFQIAQKIQDGTADPEEARRLMRLFCYFVDNELKRIKQPKELFGYQPDELMPKELLWHFRDAFKAILKGKPPKSALGLGIAGRPGRRLTKTEVHIGIATEYLRLANKGIKPTPIKKQLEIRFGIKDSQIENIWKKYKAMALMQLRIEREKNNPMRLSSPDIHWKTEEEKRLKKLYPWKAKDEKRREENRNPTLSESQQQLKYAKAQERKQLEENRNPTRYRQNPMRDKT